MYFPHLTPYVDWEMWTAAAFGPANPTLSSHILADIVKYLQNSPSRVPFSDWYDCGTSASVGFSDRPVVGGHFAILAAAKSGSGTGPVTIPKTPFNAGTYTVTVAGGRSGCNQYLSSASCSGGNLVDMYGNDDGKFLAPTTAVIKNTTMLVWVFVGSGRQRWSFSLVSGQTNVYNIQVSGGRSGCNTYLSSASCGSNLVDLYNQDDGTYCAKHTGLRTFGTLAYSLYIGSGRQRWLAVPVPGTTNQYNFMVSGGRSTCNLYLSTHDCTNSSNLVDLFNEDDSSGRQRWTLNAA